MIVIRWSNGQIDKADTWQALLDEVRLTQWRDMDEEKFRVVMYDRAWMWSNTKIDFMAPAEQLFRELQYAGLIRIEKDNTDTSAAKAGEEN